MEITIVAFGGNAISDPRKAESAAEQARKIESAILRLKGIPKMAITHGNGPEVGNLLLQQAGGRRLPLDALVAMTQGQLGYWISQAVENVLDRKAVSIVTRVLVSPSDPGFSMPAKPVGPFYRRKIFRDMAKTKDGWRRVVPSPMPLRILDIGAVRAVAEKGMVPVACGGGGVPVIKKGRKYAGVEAVIDKDYASALLGSEMGAKSLVFITNVDCVFLNYGAPGEAPVRAIRADDAEEYLRGGHFGEGSMKPKVQAAIDFIRKGGEKAVITSIGNLGAALKGRAGTLITG
ncbi:MAG TPA: carbamate kinase [archaeon]|nr:carbamate kinase [archaeon]